LIKLRSFPHNMWERVLGILYILRLY